MKLKNFSILLFILLIMISLKFNTVYYLKDQFIQSDLSDIYVSLFRGEKVFDQDHIVTTLDNGLKIIVNKHDKCVCRFVRITGHWDSNETKVLNKIVQPGFKIIEVGSNFGVYALQMAKLAGENGKIYAFEANPNVSKYLKKSVELNKLENHIQVFEMAASYKPYNGFMLYELDNIGMGYILPDTQQTIEKCQTASCVPIKVTTLNEQIKDLKIDLLKIDAEGAEFWILEGGTSILKNNPDLIMMLEWVPSHIQRNNISLDKFLTLLKGLNMNFWRIDKNGTLSPILPEDLKKSDPLDIVLSRQDIQNKYFK